MTKIIWNFRTPQPPIDSLGTVISEEFESLVKEESSGDEDEGEKIYIYYIYIYIYMYMLYRHLLPLNKYFANFPCRSYERKCIIQRSK
jgi:hypothetical protein